MQSPSPHRPDVAPAADAIIEEVKAAAAPPAPPSPPAPIPPALLRLSGPASPFGEIFASDDEPLYQKRGGMCGPMLLGPKWLMKVGPGLYREVPESDVPQRYIDDEAANEVRLKKKRKAYYEQNKGGVRSPPHGTCIARRSEGTTRRRP